MAYKSYSRWVFIYWVIILGLIAYIIAIQPSKRDIQTEGMIQGEPAKNQPVILWWLREDGTLTAESAVRTDYAGILPHSLTGSSVPFLQYADYIGYTYKP